MKIRELLELTQVEPLEDIAKNHLSIGKNAARDALKAAGCFSKNGVRGWFYEGDSSLLDQSIYEFSRVKKSQAKNKVNKPENKQTGKKINKLKTKQVGIISMKKVTYEVEESLHDELRIRAILEKKTVSEIVNSILKQGLK